MDGKCHSRFYWNTAYFSTVLNLKCVYWCNSDLLVTNLVVQLSAWCICWFWRYNIKKAPYSLDDACYLTRKALKVTLRSWQAIGKLYLRNQCITDSWFSTCMPADVFYLFANSLDIHAHSFTYLFSDELTQQDLIERRLWKKKNMDAYLIDMRKESKRRR